MVDLLSLEINFIIEKNVPTNIFKPSIYPKWYSSDTVILKEFLIWVKITCNFIARYVSWMFQEYSPSKIKIKVRDKKL